MFLCGGLQVIDMTLLKNLNKIIAILLPVAIILGGLYICAFLIWVGYNDFKDGKYAGAAMALFYFSFSLLFVWGGLESIGMITYLQNLFKFRGFDKINKDTINAKRHSELVGTELKDKEAKIDTEKSPHKNKTA